MLIERFIDKAAELLYVPATKVWPISAITTR
ncbi:MAG: hypothetical protein WC782_01625 [Methylococcaceae bacterium]